MYVTAWGLRKVGAHFHLHPPTRTLHTCQTVGFRCHFLCVGVCVRLALPRTVGDYPGLRPGLGRWVRYCHALGGFS